MAYGQVYWPCCEHCACDPKEIRPLHTFACGRSGCPAGIEGS